MVRIDKNDKNVWIWKMERTRKSEVILEYCGMSLILSAGAWLLYWVPAKEPHAGSWPFLALLLVKLSAKSIKVFEVLSDFV